MTTQVSSGAAPSGSTEASTVLDVAIIGAGFSGLHMIYKLRSMGMKIRAFETGDGVGGTWYWNRYPGCGSDIESLEYSYGFSEDLQQEWRWSKRYPPQPEIEKYLNHVADRFDLRRDIQFNTRINSAVFDEKSDMWKLTTDKGQVILARFCIMATGLLSAPKPADIPGIKDFAGTVLYTSRWPKEKVDFAGKRVGIIGTGSTAVQAIPLIAAEAGHLTVFQRTPNFTVPLRNGPLDPEYEKMVKSDYSGWRKKQMNSFGGYVSVNFQAVESNPNAAMEVSRDERLKEFEYRWSSGGLCFYTSFKDLLVDPRANEELAEFFREKIRPRIKDPAVADKLLPKGYPILTKRLCADTNYFEAFNRDNVSLVDIRETPIDKLVPEGLQVGGAVHNLDYLIIATGFDAITGALINMDIRGLGGKTIREDWSSGPRTNAGLMTAGFPNMIFTNGPGSCTGFFNPVILVEYQGAWIGDLLESMRKKGFTRVESEREADDKWVAHMREVAAPTLFWNSNNWFIGANVPGKARVMLLYLGGFKAYRDHTTVIARNGFEGFHFSATGADSKARSA